MFAFLFFLIFPLGLWITITPFHSSMQCPVWHGKFLFCEKMQCTRTSVQFLDNFVCYTYLLVVWFLLTSHNCLILSWEKALGPKNTRTSLRNYNWVLRPVLHVIVALPRCSATDNFWKIHLSALLRGSQWRSDHLRPKIPVTRIFALYWEKY